MEVNFRLGNGCAQARYTVGTLDGCLQARSSLLKHRQFKVVCEEPVFQPTTPGRNILVSVTQCLYLSHPCQRAVMYVFPDIVYINALVQSRKVLGSWFELRIST